MSPALELSSYMWEGPEKLISIQLEFELIDRMHSQIMLASDGSRRRRAEAAGILLGRSVPGPKRTVIIEDFEPAAHERTPGPPQDPTRSIRMLMEAGFADRQQREEAGLSVVGYYRMHQRDALYMDNADLLLAYDHFSGPGNVFLLIKPFASQEEAARAKTFRLGRRESPASGAGIAGFFFWEDGAISCQHSYSQFPFSQAALRGQDAQIPVLRPETAPPFSLGAPHLGIVSNAEPRFRFEVTWRSLTQPARPAPAADVPPLRAPQTDSAVSDASGLDRVRETVQPRIIPAPPAAVEARRPETIEPLVEQCDAPAPSLEGPPAPPLRAPSFANEADHGSLRNWIALAALAVLLTALIAMRRTEGPSMSPDDSVAATTEVGGTGWIAEWASDASGSARGRQLSLYRPSMHLSDYRFVFSGQIERGSLGWVFRAADSKNYYVGKLQASRFGGPLVFTSFAVVHGKEDSHVQTTLPIVSTGAPLKVRLDANQSRFTLYVQNQVVDDWRDDRLKSGGVGFLNEREERGSVESVQISFHKPRAGQ